MNISHVLINALFLLFIKSIKSLYTHVDANARDCIYEKLKSNTKFSITFEVVEGGFRDIDLLIMGPENSEIYRADRETNGKYMFTSTNEGVYSCCFDNKMSTMTPKIIMFSFDIEEAKNYTSEESTDEKHKKLEEMVNDLVINMENVKREQEFMEVRDKIHRAINENTNSRVVMWALFEAMVLIAMTIGQIYYLKRFFEVRRVI